VVKSYLSPNCQKIDAFGWYRLNILALINSMLTLQYPAVNSALNKTDIFPTVIDLMFKFEHNSFCHTLVDKICMSMLGQAKTDEVESFIKKTNLHIRILDTEKKFKIEDCGKITARKEYMPILYHLAEKINLIFEDNPRMRSYIKIREREWNKLINELRQQRQKLKDTEIKADKTAPRGKVIVEDEEGFKPTSKDTSNKPKKKALADITDEDLLDDSKFAGYGDLDDLAVEDTEKKQSETSNVSDLKEDEEGKNVMSAIDAILDGNYDSIVMDKSKLQGLTLDDILNV